jgi:serine carboxypeptidase-like clade 2
MLLARDLARPNKPKNWNYGDETADIALLFPEFFTKAPNWRLLVVSGDADAAVPFIGTERWIQCLGRPDKKPWR